MKRIILSLIVLSVFTISANAKHKRRVHHSKPKHSMIVGNDKDAHGCKGSAGYTWSEISESCIRIFELPLQLKNSIGSSIAGINFSKDNSKAEIFTNEGHSILKKLSLNNYTDTKMTLKKVNNKWVLSNNNSKKAEYSEQ